MAGIYFSRRRRGFFESMSLTFKLILINIVFFIVSLFILRIYGEEFFLTNLALTPSLIIQGRSLWTFLTSMFLHGSFLHLFVNMFVLFSMGRVMERIVGKKRFLWFYILSGIFAGAVFVLLAWLAYFFRMGETGALIFGSIDISAVGASGAIFAIAGLFVVLLPRAKFGFIFFPFISFPGYIIIPIALFGVWGLSIIGGWPIGNSAHFGGFLAGVFYGLYLRKKFPTKTKKLREHFW